jgi:hypothetical protein
VRLSQEEALVRPEQLHTLTDFTKSLASPPLLFPCRAPRARAPPALMRQACCRRTGADCRLVRPPFPRYVFGWGDTRAGQLATNLLQTADGVRLDSPDDQPPNIPRPTSLESLQARPRAHPGRRASRAVG